MADDPGAATVLRNYVPQLRHARAGALLLLALLLMVCLSLFARGLNPCSLVGFGLPGVSLLTFLSSSTVFVPAPGIAFAGLAGTLWSPMLVGAFGGVGGAVGEFTGFIVGYSGQRALGRPTGQWWDRGERLMRHYGLLAIALMAAIPNPLFDAVGLLAGSLRFPPLLFFVATLLGNTVKFGAAATLGALALGNLGC